MKKALFLGLLFASTATAQEKEPPAPVAGVDEVKVDRAIKKGIEFLRTAPSTVPDWGNFKNSDVLILLTFIHSGIPDTDPKFKQLFDSAINEPLEKTYKVALLAMCLEEVDRVKYQQKIAECAQFLVDNQCRNGQWSYGRPSEFVKEINVPEPRRSVATSSRKGGMDKDGKPKVLQHVAVKKMKEGPDLGDNSNSQYASLGLRACYDAGIKLPEHVVLMAVKWWRETTFADPKKDKEGRPVVVTGVRGKVRGWNYKTKFTDERAPYHAMTAGAVGSLVIYDYMLKRKWKRDSYVKAGMNWLTGHYRITTWNAYYMYALERVGLLYGTETLGTHVWYKDGANAILKAQKDDGSWGNKTWDTCFMILFLRRATRPLVATEGGGKLGR